LGNDYNFSEMESACWVVSCATYLKECVHRIESDPDLDGNLLPHRTPLPEVCHRELDDGNFLSELGIRKFQMLISMAQWAVTIGRLDISLLSPFSVNFRRLLVNITWSWRIIFLVTQKIP
jgi:hypothetical protein